MESIHHQYLKKYAAYTCGGSVSLDLRFKVKKVGETMIKSVSTDF